ncbi:HBS1-like protein isoform X1, partial [Tanacetum coccineum]
IDAKDEVGTRAGSVGGNDETEQTLHHLLTEISGFLSDSWVPNYVLGSRLMRSGGFGRYSNVDRIDITGRSCISNYTVKEEFWNRRFHWWEWRRRKRVRGARPGRYKGPSLLESIDGVWDFPVAVSNHLELKILVLDVQIPILIGSQLEFHIHHAKETARVKKIVSLLDSMAGKV